ncbi:ABC transporter ATP-binding protein [Eoetvoesiella sp.]|uniref:ABC transporter ATP-binding protein n=1 Tax=Eoetvoesiella sp. TaxID=1966355 RepID=UPI0039C879D7
MRSNIAIDIRGLSKRYEIYSKPRDRLLQMLARGTKQYFKEFWALRNVSLSIKKGEVIAILGRNGSGKSTLLQLVCGTLNPTEGAVETQGRIAALLELGAGFNPEFSGRENVYLNGSVLGLSRKEIDAKFQEIASFADIGEFIEQPVKTYSSGMYVRLAFAVQACVDPEVLIVDEALSVGDIGFQYKCFKRIEALKQKGVTILMVTHSTGTVLEYADRCVVLERGEVLTDTTDVLAAVLAYEKGMLAPDTPVNNPDIAVSREVFSHNALSRMVTEQINQRIGEKRFGTARAIIKDLSVVAADGRVFSDGALLKSGEEVVFRFELAACEPITDVVLGVSVSKTQGNDIWGDNNICASTPINLTPGLQQVEFCAKLPIASGDYLLHAGLARIQDEIREELDQRRPISTLKFWSPREQVGFVYAPITVRL